MIINPIQAINNKWIDNVDNDCIQQNGIDMRVKNIYYLNANSIGDITNKIHAERVCVEPHNNEYVLQPGVYDVEFVNYVNIPAKICAMIMQRSSCNRNAVLVQSGLYDSGFHGYVGGMIYVLHNTIRMTINERVCQLVFMEADNNLLYEGMYNHTKEVK